MSEGDQTGALSLSQGEELPGRLWAFGEFTTNEDRSAAELATGFTSVGFVRQALRRSAWLWCTTAVLGLLIGSAAFVKFPPAYQGSATILLANNPFEQPAAAALDDQAILQSRTVAGDALRKLGLHESPGIFVGQYTVTVVTSRVLVVTVKAKSYQTAISEANALAAAFLAFLANQLGHQKQVVSASLQQQVSQAQQRVNAISQEIRSLQIQPPSPTRHTELGRLTNERDAATTALTSLRQGIQADQATTQIQNTKVIKGSQVLDPGAPLPQHAKKYLLLYVVGGLIAGLALGLSIVIIRALVSDRLRRRDDVARALGAPVEFSVGKVLPGRWRRRGALGLADADSPAIRHIAAYLGNAVPPSSPGPASLAVVAADDVQIPAACLASLAVSCAREGRQVVLADLCAGSPAARMLGATSPGVQAVRADGMHLLVAIPDADDVAPAGPLRDRSRRPKTDEQLAAACASADLLLTLAAFDPSVGGRHLAGWARSAVAIVTTGQSSAARIQAVGEMIRLAGVELIAAVLVGADKGDESLGVTEPYRPSASVGPSLDS